MDIKAILRESGIVGAGGAGFPSYGKIAPGADTLVINGAECEPLLHTDFEILRQHMTEVMAGAELLAAEAGISRVILGIEQHNATALGLEHGQSLGKLSTLHVLPDMYPMGDEITLIYEATGRLVQPGSLPITQGVIVYNVETLYNFYQAATTGKPLTEKWLTVGGDIGKSYVLRVPIGTRVRDLLASLDLRVPATHRLLSGGPSMGKVVNPNAEIVTKTTKGLLILPATIPAVASKIAARDVQMRRASSACCQCTRCTDMCPRHLLGYPLEPHRMIRAAMSTNELDPALYTSATLCCACGICEIAACCQELSPRAVIDEMKKKLAAKKMRFDAKGVTYQPDAMRDARRMPSSRWRTLLGVEPYNREAEFLAESKAPAVIEIPMRQHIGAPSLPAVKVGDVVEAGQLIATAADGLSIPQHASLAGHVVLADADKIIIEKV